MPFNNVDLQKLGIALSKKILLHYTANYQYNFHLLYLYRNNHYFA